MSAPALKPTPTRPEWYRNSGVIECDWCDGKGSYWNGRGHGGNDPDSCDIECAACDGVGHFPCATCGFDVPTGGYDCLVCDTIWSLGPTDAAKIKPDELAAAFAKCIAAMKKGLAP